MPYTCTGCGKIADYYSDHTSSIKNVELCSDCVLERIKDIIHDNRQKDVIFGFDEDIEYDGENLALSGYTYFTYEIASQMYVPDVKQVVKRLEEEGKLEEIKEQAMEVYDDDSEYHIACIVDHNDYKERAQNIKKALEKHEQITVDIDEEDNSFFVDIKVALVVDNYYGEEFFSKIDNLMDDIKEAVCSQKF